MLLDDQWICIGTGTGGWLSDLCLNCSQRHTLRPKRAIAPPAKLIAGEWVCSERRFHGWNPALPIDSREPLRVGERPGGGGRGRAQTGAAT